MVSVSLMAPGEASQFPPPLLPDAPGLSAYRALFATTGIAALFPQQPDCRDARHHAVARLQRDRRLRLRQAASSAAATASSSCSLAALGHPRPGGDAALVPDAQGDRPDQQLRRRAGAGDREHLRHLPGAPICAVDPRRIARGGAHRRRQRGPHLPADRRAGADPDPGDAWRCSPSSACGTTSCGR